MRARVNAGRLLHDLARDGRFIVGALLELPLLYAETGNPRKNEQQAAADDRRLAAAWIRKPA